MEINNDIRRLKTKLKLIEEEGFSWVVGDMLDYDGNGPLSIEETERVVKNLKLYYLKQLEKLSPKEHKQGKLDI